MDGHSGKPEPVFDDEIDAKLRREREQEARREAARLRFRELFPVTTEFADECRKHFGDQVEVIYAIEDGLYVGKVPEERLKFYEEKRGVPLRKVRLFEPDHPHDERHPKR